MTSNHGLLSSEWVEKFGGHVDEVSVQGVQCYQYSRGFKVPLMSIPWLQK